MSQNLARWSPRKPRGIRGGGLLSSALPTAGDGQHHATAEYEHLASAVASTSKFIINEQLSVIPVLSDDEEPPARGRALSVDSNAIDEVDFEPRRLMKKRRVVAGKGKGKGTEKAKDVEFETTLPWPEHFIKLQQTFKVRTRARRPGSGIASLLTDCGGSSESRL